MDVQEMTDDKNIDSGFRGLGKYISDPESILISASEIKDRRLSPSISSPAFQITPKLCLLVFFIVAGLAFYFVASSGAFNPHNNSTSIYNTILNENLAQERQQQAQVQTQGSAELSVPSESTNTNFKEDKDDPLNQPVASLISSKWITGKAGFDCYLARLDTDKVICSIPELGALDAKQSKIYEKSLAETKGIHGSSEARIRLVNDQTKWVENLNLCKTGTCIKEALKNRTDKLKSLMSSGEVIARYTPDINSAGPYVKFITRFYRPHETASGTKLIYKSFDGFDTEYFMKKVGENHIQIPEGDLVFMIFDGTSIDKDPPRVVSGILGIFVFLNQNLIAVNSEIRMGQSGSTGISNIKFRKFGKNSWGYSGENSYWGGGQSGSSVFTTFLHERKLVYGELEFEHSSGFEDFLVEYTGTYEFTEISDEKTGLYKILLDISGENHRRKFKHVRIPAAYDIKAQNWRTPSEYDMYLK